jgi:hypothetical protein
MHTTAQIAGALQKRTYTQCYKKLEHKTSQQHKKTKVPKTTLEATGARNLEWYHMTKHRQQERDKKTWSRSVLVQLEHDQHPRRNATRVVFDYFWSRDERRVPADTVTAVVGVFAAFVRDELKLGLTHLGDTPA